MFTRNTDYTIQRLRGLSTDTKPTDVPNGSEFREMDTGKTLCTMRSSVIGRSSIKGWRWGGGSGTMKVTFDVQSDDDVTADKTFEEVYQAVENGAYVYAVKQQGPEIYHLMTAFALEVVFSLVSVSGGTEVVQEKLSIDSNDNAVRQIASYPN